MVCCVDWNYDGKSIYITNNYKHEGSRAEILEAVDWEKNPRKIQEQG